MKQILYLVVAGLFSACQNSPEPLQLNQGVYLSNITVISSENGRYAPYSGHVVTDGDRIVYVGRTPPHISGEFEEIDGKGKFVIPGLIDSHVHITEVQGMLPHHMEQHPELVSAFNKQMPRSYLYHGFTTLINLGGISDEQISAFNAHPLHPDLLHTGRSGAAVANGYPMNFSPEEYRFQATPNFLYLESEAGSIPEEFKPSDHTPAAVVKRIKNSGGIAVKSYYESGFRGMPRLPVPTEELMADLLEAAHANGLVLTVHGNSLSAHAFLAQAGVDIIAHGMWNWDTFQDVPADSLPAEVRQVLDQQIQKGIGYTPTLTVISGEEALADTTFLDTPELKKVVPGSVLDWYRTEEGQWFARDLFEAYAAEEVHAIYGRIQAHAKRALKYFSDNGGNLLFGTDTPSAPTYGNQPGYNGYWELELMHEAGVPYEQILASATINNARAFQLDTELGSLQAGKKANLLVLKGNPLEDISAYNSIEYVILGGRKILRTELSVN